MNSVINSIILIIYIRIKTINLWEDYTCNIFTVINVFILVAFIVALWIMAKKHVSFPKRVFTALGIGIVYGIVLHLSYGVDSNILTQTTDWFSIVGDG